MCRASVRKRMNTTPGNSGERRSRAGKPAVFTDEHHPVALIGQ